jgi:hypothetical protein
MLALFWFVVAIIALDYWSIAIDVRRRVMRARLLSNLPELSRLLSNLPELSEVLEQCRTKK